MVLFKLLYQVFNRKRLLFLCLFMLVCNLSYSQERKFKKNYNYLKSGDFVKVYKNLNDIRSKDTTSPFLFYLMSLYFGDKNNVDRNIDSSYLYLKKSFSLTSSYTDKKELVESCEDIKYCILNLPAQLDSISNVAYEICLAKNDITSLRQFINLYKGTFEESKAMKRLDQLLYYKAKENQSVPTLESFVANYPNSDYIDSAKKNIENIFYFDAITKDDIDTYNRFLKQYPISVFKDEIVLKRDKKAFDLAVLSDSETEYNSFITTYPKSIFVKEATTRRDKIAFDNALSSDTETGYNLFIAQYPQSTFVKEAILKRDKIAFDNALSSNTETGYNSFIAQYSRSTFVTEAIIKRDKIVYDEAKAKNDITTYKIVLEKYPDIAYANNINEDIMQLEQIQLDPSVDAEIYDQLFAHAEADDYDIEADEVDTANYFSQLPDKSVQPAQGGTGTNTVGSGRRYNSPRLTSTTKIKGQKNENLKLKQTQKLRGTPLYKSIVSADGKKQITGSIYSAKGFRIVIYNGSDKNAALAAKNKFSRAFSGTRSYFSYNVPSYKIKIGDFENKNDATKFMSHLMAIFPSSFITNDFVTIKKIKITR